MLLKKESDKLPHRFLHICRLAKKCKWSVYYEQDLAHQGWFRLQNQPDKMNNQYLFDNGSQVTKNSTCAQFIVYSFVQPEDIS